MTWQNPWAWLGLAAVALPILIHLLGRGRARVHRFPTLRFLDASRLLPTRRSRVHDLLLLVIRVAIIAAAVAALAQPLLLTANRRTALGNPMARAIIVDTSASMQRATPAGERAIVAARRIATQLADSATTSVVIESAAPAQAIAGASSWLLTQPSRGEIDIVSDFQAGMIDAQDLRAVPQRLGVRLSRVDVDRASTVETRSRVGGNVLVASATPQADHTDAQWTSRPAASGALPNSLMLLGGDRERTRLGAAEHAAATVGVLLPFDTSRAIAIVYPEFAGRAALLRGATAPNAPWMTTAVARLRGDSLLAGVAADATAISSADSTIGIIVARTLSGLPIATALQATVDGPARLLLVANVNAGSLASAALIAAATRVESAAPPLAELEPNTLPDDVITSWQRAASSLAPSQANGNGGASDGRWLWLVALLLIALESWARRSPRRDEIATAEPRPLTADRSHVA